MNDLFITEVGSRMWGMEEFASDYDMFHCYILPYRNVLIGNISKTQPRLTYFDGGKEIDAQYMEIGHLISLLKKSNVNAIWAVCSPVVHVESECRLRLKKIIEDNLTKSIYYSVAGMANSQLRDSFVKNPEKIRAACLRTLEFGIRVLEGKGIHFYKPSCESSIYNIREAQMKLDSVYENTHLPINATPDVYDNFLYDLRLDHILEEFEEEDSIL